MYGHDPLLFVISGGAIYFTWGEIYSLFPATCTDAYGQEYATTNAGMLYTAKGTAALVGAARPMSRPSRRLAHGVVDGRRRQYRGGADGAFGAAPDAQGAPGQDT